MVDLGTLGGRPQRRHRGQRRAARWSAQLRRRLRAPRVLVDAGGRDGRPRHARRPPTAMRRRSTQRPGRRHSSVTADGNSTRSPGRRRAGWSTSAPSAAAISMRSRSTTSGQVVGYSQPPPMQRRSRVLVDAGGRDGRPRHARRQRTACVGGQRPRPGGRLQLPLPAGAVSTRSRGRRRAGWSTSARSAAASPRHER